MSASRRYSDEELLEIGRDAVRQHGHELTLHQFCRVATCSTMVIYNHFGSWTNLRHRLGLGRREYRGIGRQFSDADLIDALRRAANDLGPDLTSRDFSQHSGRAENIIYRRFGSWPKFRAAAGLDPHPSRNRYSKEELLARGRQAYAQRGGNFSLNDFMHLTGISASTIYKHFGTWDDYRRQVHPAPDNPRPPKRRIYSRTRLIDLIRSVAAQTSQHLTLRDFSRRTGIPETTVYRFFTTWAEARDCADLEPHVRRRAGYSDDFLLDDLHRVARLLRRTPTRDDYKASGVAAAKTLQQRFGPTWKHVQQRYEKYREYRAAFPNGPPQLSGNPAERERQMLRLLGASDDR